LVRGQSRPDLLDRGKEAAALERDAPLLLAVGAGWSPGVLGLVAARLVERHHRPAVVIGTADGIGKGSARSVAGFDLGSRARSAQVREVGGAQVDCCLCDPAGGRVRAIAFRSSDQPLGRALLQAAGAPLHLAGSVKLDWWEGQPRVSFHIEDAATA
jgi:hypothetical protein